MEKIDYLVAGHISADVIPGGTKIGGAVAYAGRTAQALGCRTAALTSAAPGYNWEAALPGILVHAVPAAETTTFENVYTPSGRVQTVHGWAERLTTAHLPESWKRASIVHLAPIANEVDPDLIYSFSNSVVGLTPQGWLRRWDENGRVYATNWERAAEILPLAAAVILSEEDLPDRATLEAYRQWSRLLVLTQGKEGCTLFMDDEVQHIPAPVVREVEPTGAGDIFAAAFLTRLYQTAGNPWEAARFANEIASLSVTKPDLPSKITLIQEHMRQYIER
ncbi:MAG: ribokinase [Chloroflexi bacterium]|nr:MAG: ribokinase [Chloroflexota bacterium]